MSKVLVVGAGPTGLVLANELARRDVPLRLIDQAPAPSPHSRAFGIQPGSLLALGDAFGDALADELIAAGHQVRAIVAHLDDRPALEIPFEVEGRYPFLLLLPQADTERILRDRLTQAGVAVEWGCALERLAQDGDEVRCTAGGVESLHAWVAGCDGAHSTVRHQLQVAFDGHPYVGDFMLADVEVEWPFSPDAVHVFSNERGTVAAFPFRDRRCRFFVVKREPVAEDAPLDEAGFAADVRAIVGGQAALGGWRWLTRFRLHHRLAATWQRGRVFLLGDAAHIHSPVGGQGMNLGMQDALVLGHLLAGSLDRNVDLGAYQRLRKPVAIGVVRGTDLVFKQALSGSPTWRRFLRRWLAPTLLRSGAVRRAGLRRVAQLDMAEQVIAFRASPP